jgi:hypothetical protein
MKLTIIALSLLCCTCALAEVDSSDAPERSNVAPMQDSSDLKPDAQQCSNFMRHARAIPALKSSAEYKYCLKQYGAAAAPTHTESGTGNDVGPASVPP